MEDDWKRKLCERNAQKWVLGHRAYKLSETQSNASYYVTTNRGTHRAFPGFFIEDPQQRGFLLITPMDDDGCWFELYFALVDKDHRRQGVLRTMVNNAVKRLPSGCTIWLECRTDVAACWKSLKFSQTNNKAKHSVVYDTCDCEFKLVVP